MRGSAIFPPAGIVNGQRSGQTGTSTDGSNFDFGNLHVGTTTLEEVSPLHIAWDFDSHNESNTAYGDSGGPAFVQIGSNYYVAGVTSGGTSDPFLLGDGSFDTRVDVFADWIDAVVSGGIGPAVDSGDDHADVVGAEASVVQFGEDSFGFQHGELEEMGDRDVFRVAFGVDTYLRVYDEDGVLLGENDDSAWSDFLTFDSQLDITSPNIAPFDLDTSGRGHANAHLTLGNRDLFSLTMQ